MGIVRQHPDHPPRTDHQILYLRPVPPPPTEDARTEDTRVADPIASADQAFDAPSSEPDDERVTRMVVASGSSFELFTAVIGLGLAIMGLAGFAPIYLASLATVALGFSLLAQGFTLAARWREAVRIAGSERTDAMGIGTEIFGGLVAVVLGMLALLEIVPLTLLPAAALVLGIALLLGGPAQPDLGEVAQAPTASQPRWSVSRTAVRTSSGVMVMGGSPRSCSACSRARGSPRPSRSR